jgi:1-acyl-sn-glycerol-3-phosphate acyltransferase
MHVRPAGFVANPLLRRLVLGCGFVATATHKSLDGEERLNMGFDVVVFTKGTRSPRNGSLHPLCRGAFEMAARTSVPIVLMKLTVCRAIEQRDRDVGSCTGRGEPLARFATHLA